MNLDQRHFAKLVDCYRTIKATPDLPKSVWPSGSSRDWLASVEKQGRIEAIDVNRAILSDIPYDRHQLLGKIADTKDKMSSEALKELVIDILAWGGMFKIHARTALPNWNSWIGVCSSLAEGMEAVEAYDCFRQLRHRGSMERMGPAYYTKLIYFLGNGDGLIMDQWTARSTNLLFGALIKMQSRTMVSDWNDAAIYQNYLGRVQALSDHLSSAVGKEVSPHETEELIFSFTGTPSKKGRLNEAQHSAVSAWRRYLIEQDRP